MIAAAPTCSVVIPVLDDAGPLDRCLRALAGQRTTPLEILVVDNGSTDDSGAVAERHGALLLHEPHAGIMAAAATGYDAAAGDLILRLDADSVPSSDWISRMTAAFTGDAGLDALSGPGVFTAIPRSLRHALTDWYWRSYFDRLRPRVGAAPLFGSNLGMRRSAWDAVSAQVHRDDPEVHDDLELSIHLVQSGARLAIDPRLVVAVSARPLLHPIGLLVRARRAAHTMALHADGSTASVTRAELSG